MGLKFRRGSTAQQSGSLAFGEPYVNTTLGTLVVGGATGDIVLSAGGTGSTGNFGAISGSGLDITGNANIAGNLTLGGAITIGDASADTVNVVASLSSSLIPSIDSIFDLGSPSKQWRDLYLSSASLYIDGTQVLSSTATELIFTTDTGQGIKFNELGTDNITMQTVDGDIELKSSGGGDVLLDPTTGIISVKGNVSMQDGTSKFLSSGGTNIVFGNDLVITGSIVTTGNINGLTLSNGIVSSSAQTIANLPTGVVSSSAQTIANLPTGTISGSSQLSGTSITDLTIVNLTTVNQTASVVFSSGSNRFGDFGNDTHQFTGSVQISGSLTTIGASTATSFNGAINSTNGVVSGSSQISHDSTTGYSANKHIDHTSVLISAGNGLSGGGDISSTRTLTLDTGSATFTTGVKTTLNTNTVVSGSSQITFSGISSLPTLVSGSSQITNIQNAQLANSSISGVSLGGNLATLTIGTGLSGTSYNGSSLVTIANSGVTSITGTANQVVASGATGAVTLSLPQSIHTTATPTFGNLTITGTITATGDITAFFTSDIRHKNNVQLIDNALDKVNALNGVTWEWNDDVDEVTKQTPKTGLIAQDVLDVLPEVVKTRENGFLALDYSKMIGLLVEAIKEQDIVIQKLKSDMIGLGTTITVFEERMKEKGLL